MKTYIKEGDNVRVSETVQKVEERTFSKEQIAREIKFHQEQIDNHQAKIDELNGIIAESAKVGINLS